MTKLATGTGAALANALMAPKAGEERVALSIGGHIAVVSRTDRDVQVSIHGEWHRVDPVQISRLHKLFREADVRNAIDDHEEASHAGRL